MQGTVEVAVVSPQSDVGRACLNEYFRELAERFSAGFDPAKSSLPDPDSMSAPTGCFLVATIDGRAVGCGGFKMSGDDAAEIKRMWVSPAVRGQGIGRRLLEALEEHAREAGCRVARLDTNETLHEAHRLYRRAGYREIPRFNDEPYAHLWFEKVLSTQTFP